MSIERAADAVAHCFLLERDLYEHGWEREFDGEVIGRHRRRRVRRLRRRATRASCRSGACAATGGSSTSEGTILVGAETGRTIRIGDPVRVRVRQVDAPRGRVDLELAAVGSPAMAKAKKRKVAPGDVATNRQASYRFELLDKLECGIVLQGTEVKSLRGGAVQIKDGYAAHPRGRAVAAQRPHPALRAGRARQPRARAAAQAAGPPPRDRAPRPAACRSAG